jgi:CBS domain-containing protein
MTTAAELLQYKGNAVISIAQDATVFEALQRMSNHNVGALLVMEDGRVIGILSERDYARKVILQGRASKSTRVGDIMSRAFISVTPATPAEECLGIMTEKRVRHLPVIDDTVLVGLISIGDVVRAIIADREFTIEQLERYITS